MATLEELKSVLKESLEVRGVLSDIKARIRKEIFQVLDEDEMKRPIASAENLIINELIREYLGFNHYNHSLSVFIAETNQPKEALEHRFLAKDVNIIQNDLTSSVPVIYSLVSKSRSLKNLSDNSLRIDDDSSSVFVPSFSKVVSGHHDESSVDFESGVSTGFPSIMDRTVLTQSQLNQDYPEPVILSRHDK